MPRPTVVVKVGGSLYDWPELGPRLRQWLTTLDDFNVVLIPGGGPTVETLRALDRCHHLGEEAAHWLALRALTLNAHFLANLLPGATVVPTVPERTLTSTGPLIFDAHAFARWDDALHPGACLPHTWQATSDSLAARVAIVTDALHLYLLKSVTIPPDLDWHEAAERGFVDPLFAEVIQSARQPLQVIAVNLRES